MSLNDIKNFREGCVKPPTVIGQFHTLFLPSIQMFFLRVLGFAVHGNEALRSSCDPDEREINRFCYNQFRPITPQVLWALQLVVVLVPDATFHLHVACKSNQECLLQRPIYTIHIPPVLLRINLELLRIKNPEVISFWLQVHHFGFQIKPFYPCDTESLGKKTIIKCMGPEHFEKTGFLIAMYTFTVITMILCVTEVFEIIFRLCFLIKQ
ncbi:LOW QUALITY PROTEIN: putative gap junction epsilon-1 protein [Glossophaga mutica]